jgi:hypothetical protein
LFLEDYAVQFCYIKGESNSLADALSHLPFDERQNPPDRHNHPHNLHDATGHIQTLESYSAMANNADLLDLFIHLPLSENAPFVLDYQSIVQAQIGNRTPANFQQRLLVPNISIWCHTNNANQVDASQQWKIYLPNALLANAICWYHLALSPNCLTDTMSETFYNPNLRPRVEVIIKPCEHCQKYKNVQHGHGATEAGLLPWSEIAMDMIGP